MREILVSVDISTFKNEDEKTHEKKRTKKDKSGRKMDTAFESTLTVEQACFITW